MHLLGKQPGQREARWTHLLGAGPIEEAAPADASASPSNDASPVERRLARIEERLDELERALAQRGVLG